MCVRENTVLDVTHAVYSQPGFEELFHSNAFVNAANNAATPQAAVATAHPVLAQSPRNKRMVVTLCATVG